MSNIDKPLMTFNSHIEGKNAEVAIYADRIEWGRQGRMGAGSKLALGAMTMGISLAKTGVRRSGDSEMIPVKSISSVVVERDGLRQKVKVVCSGNTIDFRCSREEAEKVKTLLTDLMLGRHPSQSLPAAASPTPQPAPVAAERAGADVADQLAKLAEMRTSGLLTDDEFAAAKARLLGQ
mgnify:CR=1 FL=1